MKILHLYLIILLCFSFSGFAQKDYLPARILDQPDGVTVEFFDYRMYNRSNHTEPRFSYGVFIGKKLNLRYDLPFIFGKDQEKKYRLIPEYKKKLDSLVQFITYELIDSLNFCCRANKCGDTDYGYMIQIKKGKQELGTFLDLHKITPELCGYPQFIEAIRIFNEIIEATNKK